MQLKRWVLINGGLAIGLLLYELLFWTVEFPRWTGWESVGIWLGGAGMSAAYECFYVREVRPCAGMEVSHRRL